MGRKTDMMSLWFSLKGRISRRDFWIKIYLPCLVIFICAFILDLFTNQIGNNVGFGISAIASLITFWPMLAAFIKRSHDRNRSGWFVVLFIAPIINIWPTIEIYFLPGTCGENQYGLDPLKEITSNQRIELTVYNASHLFVCMV